MTQSQRQYRAAVIGHTGRGNYGHGLDVAFVGFPNIEIVAIADPDETGRQQTQKRTGAATAYADYREMVQQEQPDLVAIGPRWVGDRVEMVRAVAEAGAHMYVEKPLAASLAAADAIVDVCQQNNVKIAVAHQGRLAPITLYTQRLLQEGAIGRLRLVRGFGKMDRRGGGQDLMILGTHIMDLMRLFAGDASWASADLLSGSSLAQTEDIRAGDEEIGPILGNGLRATFGFENDVVGFFESFVGLGAVGETPYGLELVGESGLFSLRGGLHRRLFRYPQPYVVPGAESLWEEVLLPATGATDTPLHQFQEANRKLILDLLEAIENDREPASSGLRARAALEMIQAVAAAHASGGRIHLPLQQREHPYRGQLETK